MGIVQLHVYINISSGKPEFLFQQDLNSPPRLFLEIVPTINTGTCIHCRSLGASGDQWECSAKQYEIVMCKICST